MIKNYMADVAKMLGVELGEEFNLVDKDGTPSAYNPFRIEVGGFMDCAGEDDAGFIVAHVHDEVIIEAPKDKGSLEEVIAIMTKNADWNKGLKMNAAGFEAEYYMKD